MSTDIYKDEQYCLLEICKIRELIGLKTTYQSTEKIDTIRWTLGLMFLHGNEKVSHFAQLTLEEFIQREVLVLRYGIVAQR